MQIRVSILVGLCLSCLVPARQLSAQLAYPANAQVDHYFAQVADGGNDQQRWQTKFFFVNPTASTAHGRVTFYRQNGSALQVDLGSGPGTTFAFQIPPNGAIAFLTTGSPSTVNSGWAYATFDAPVQANAEYRMLVGGSIARTASVNGVSPALFYQNFADSSTALAVANPNSSAVTVQMTLLSSSGSMVGQITRTIDPLNQIAVVVNQLFTVTQNFVGSLKIKSTSSDNLPIASLSLDADGTGLLGSLPHGAFAFPPAHASNIRLIFGQLVRAVEQRYPGQLGQVQLVISTDPLADANASTTDGTVRISLGLAELLESEPSELAFVIAHELGHIFNARNGFPVNEPFADSFGMEAVLLAGYDPYGTGGALGRLLFVAQRGFLVIGFDDLTDPQQSFTTRLNTLYGELITICNNEQNNSLCSDERRILHPHLPGVLAVPAPSPRSLAQK